MTTFVEKHGKISNYKTKNGKNIIISKSQKSMSPRTFLKHFVYENLPQTKYIKKITDDEFIIPKESEYKNIISINYNCKQLKSIYADFIN